MAQALAGYDASDEDVIKSQTGFAMYDSQNGWIGSLTFMEPAKGYMLYRKQPVDTTFYYPVNIDPFGGRAHRNTEILTNSQTPVISNFNYSNNMTVTAVIGNEYTTQPGDIIYASAGGEIRGKARIEQNGVTHQGILFFNIAGEQEQPVSFMLERNNKIIAASDAILSYLSNRRTGTIGNPL